MKRATFKVLFYLRKTIILKDGTNPIYARITVNGQRAEFSLQMSIPDTQWNKHKGCIVGFTKTAKKQNASLELVRRKLYEYKLELEEKGIEVTAPALRNSYLGIQDNPKTILSIFKEHNDRCKKLINIDFAPGTVQRYETCYKHVKEFITLTNSKNDLLITDINQQVILDFEFYLKTERKCGHNTSTKYIKNLKKLFA